MGVPLQYSTGMACVVGNAMLPLRVAIHLFCRRRRRPDPTPCSSVLAGLGPCKLALCMLALELATVCKAARLCP